MKVLEVHKINGVGTVVVVEIQNSIVLAIGDVVSVNGNVTSIKSFEFFYDVCWNNILAERGSVITMGLKNVNFVINQGDIIKMVTSPIYKVDCVLHKGKSQPVG